MPIAITRNTKLIRLKTTVTDNGRKKARTGMQAGHTPSKMPMIDPEVAVFALSTEQQGATFLL